MTPPYRICLKPGCGRLVKVDNVKESALTCNGYSCKKYMEFIADANFENADGTRFDIEHVGMEYFKMLKIFDVTLDKEMMKNYTDELRQAISDVHDNIVAERTSFSSSVGKKRSRTSYQDYCYGVVERDRDREMDDDPNTLSAATEAIIKEHIIKAGRDISDDAFNAITDQESLVRFCYETVLGPFGAAADLEERWITRDDYV